MAIYTYQKNNTAIFSAIFFFIGVITYNLKHISKEISIIEEPINNVKIIGKIDAINFKNNGLRVRLKELECQNCNTKLPKKIILTLKNEENIKIGQRIEASGKLIGLPQKVYPFYYDSEAKYRFNKIGGFLLGKNLKILDNTKSLINMPRNRVISTFEKLESRDVEGVSLALFMGEKGKISEDLYKVVKNAGAAHILAISGLHMSIISFLVFGFLWYVFALIPAFTLHFDTKKIAAFLGCIFGLFFVVLASSPISAIRSYIMILMLFSGIIFSRESDSMRSLAVAGITILAIWPEELFYPSFQLSFSSVLCLIKMPNFNSRTVLKKILFYIGVTAFSSAAISVITAPFAIHHFTYIHLYGFLANILILPILSFFTMPFGLFSILTGLESALFLYAKSVELILVLCRTIGAFPHSSIFANYVFSWQLGLYTAGIIPALCLKNYLRYAGITIIACSIISMLFNAKPDFIVDKENAVFKVGNDYYTPFKINNKFAAKVWEEKLGSSILPAHSSKNNCTNGLCIGEKSIIIISDTGFNQLKKLCREDALKYEKTLINMVDNASQICIENKCCNFKKTITVTELENRGTHTGFDGKIFYSYEGS